MLQNTINRVRKSLHAFNLYQNKLGIAGTIQYSLRRLITKKGNLIPVKLKTGERLFLRSKSYDTIIFSQIFIYEELNFPLLDAPKTIIDCGANIGLATLYFKIKYPQAQIISVEPESSNFELLEKNTSSLTGVNLIKKGIWSKTCDLYLVDLGEGNASFRVSESDPVTNVIGKIEAISINDIFQNFNLSNIDLLKIDIEGAEFNCFKNNSMAWVDNTSCIAIEIHEYMFPGCKALIDNCLQHFEYDLNGEYHIYRKKLVA